MILAVEDVDIIAVADIGALANVDNELGTA